MINQATDLQDAKDLTIAAGGQTRFLSGTVVSAGAQLLQAQI